MPFDRDPFHGDEYRRGFSAGVIVGALVVGILAAIAVVLSQA